MTDSSDHLRGAMQAALNTKDIVTYREEEATLTITIHKELLNLEEYSITFVKAFLQNSLRGYTPGVDTRLRAYSAAAALQKVSICV